MSSFTYISAKADSPCSAVCLR